MANKKLKKFVDTIMGDKRDYSPEAIKSELKEKGLNAVETVTVQNEVTGKLTEVTIERDGTPESKLVIALADLKLTRDQKDHVVSMYLFERGKDNASFMMDIVRYKGQHTKETRAFKSQMRFDFETFVNSFVRHLIASAEAIAEELGYSDFRTVARQYVDWVKTEKAKDLPAPPVLTIRKFFYDARGETVSLESAAMINLAFRNFAEADLLGDQVRSVTEGRLREKGHGIYIGIQGKPYTIFDKDVVEVVQKDKERVEQLAKEELTDL